MCVILKYAKISCVVCKKEKKTLLLSLIFNCLLSDLVAIAQYFTGGEKHKRTWQRLNLNLNDGTSSFPGDIRIVPRLFISLDRPQSRPIDNDNQAWHEKLSCQELLVTV